MTPASQEALSILRHTGNVSWTVLFGLGLVIYAYIGELEKKNWDAILMGLLFSSVEFIWEVMNALILHFTGYAPLWATPSGTSFLILSGINIEIFLLFMLAGLCLVKSLQTFDNEPDTKILGIRYVYFIPLCWGLFCVFIEALLNRAGLLVWTYKYWNFPHLWSVTINYMVPFFLCTWGHFRVSRPAKTRLLALFLVMDVACWAVFVQMLEWI